LVHDVEEVLVVVVGCLEVGADGGEGFGSGDAVEAPRDLVVD